MKRPDAQPARNGRVGQGLAWSLLLGVIVADVLSGRNAVLVSMAITAPLLCALTASPRATLTVSGAAVVFAAAAFLWDHSFPSWRYWVPLLVVASASGFALLTAQYRGRVVGDAERLRILAELADAAAAGPGVRELARGVAELLVPRLVDFCVVSQVNAGVEQRQGAAYRGDPRLLEAFLARDPLPAGHCVDESTGRPATKYLPQIDEDVRRRIAADSGHLQLLRDLGLTSSVTIPLLARDRYVGSLLLATTAARARLTSDDVAYIETLAGRLALAIDNAVLTGELTQTERQLDAILDGVDAAITVRSIDGQMVYANPAAARLLKVSDPQTLMTMPMASVLERFDVYTEAGEPVDLQDLPISKVLAGELHPEPITVRNVVKQTGEERWLLNKATPVLGPDGKVALSVSVIEDVTATKRNEVAQRLLASTARELAETSDPGAAMQVVTQAAVPGLADWAGVDLIEDGHLRTVAISHRDPEKVRLGWRLRIGWPADMSEEGGIAQVLRSGKPELISEITDEMLVLGARDEEHLQVLREVGLNSTMIAPICAGDAPLGSLSFVSSTSRRFDDQDLQLAMDLGNQLGMFLTNARLNAEQAHIAHTLQASLLPTDMAHPPGWTISAAYRAAGLANEVGGDFYDVIDFDGGWAALIGDVTGKGATAAALTSMARHTVEAILAAGADAGEALAVLNRRLLQRPAREHALTTMAMLIVRNGRATVLSAGHPLPLLRRGATVSEIGRSDPLLGFLPQPSFHPTEVELEPDDQLILYTDGALDARGAKARFGEQRLQAAVSAVPAGQHHRAAHLIVAAIERFLEGEQGDDIAILVLTNHGESGQSR